MQGRLTGGEIARRNFPFRRVATRFEKTARNYLAVVIIAATILWLR